MPANGTDPELTGDCVAGFIDAEGHFAVVEMSGGGSFSCYMIVAVRDDDVDLLHAMARTTGLGVVRHKDFRGNAQACWSVYRKEHAVALAEYLTRHPLRTRKRHDFEAWSAAVKVWTSSGRSRSARMSTLARRIREVRRYSPPDLVVVAPAVRRNGFYDWFGGFFAGDGHLGISGGRPRIIVKLRADDAPILAAIRDATGAGELYGPYPNRGSHPTVAWQVSQSSDMLDLVRRLAGRVPGRKGLELEIWRTAAEARADERLAPERRREIIDDAESRLRDVRRYRPGAPSPAAKSRRLQRMYEQNRSWVVLLRRWAGEEPGALTAVKYDRWRPRGSPTRNTLAARFGSWYDALDAAGLAHRAAIAPEERDVRLSAGAPARAERRIAQRERVVAAVKRCAAALGHFPGPTDYARWRLHNEASAPTFVTAYRIFDGGWSELRAACETSLPSATDAMSTVSV